MLLLNCTILLTSDPTLSLEAMMRETECVSLLTWGVYRIYPLDMMANKYTVIYKQHATRNDRKRAIFTEFLSKHPYPRWALIVGLLKELERNGTARSGLAQELKEKYLTSE